jgi:hypothetical protein
VSDYTPTTEEMRHVYRGSLVQTETNIYTFVDETQADAEFDRWLAEVKAKAWDEGYVSSDDYYGEHDNPYQGDK